MPSPHPASRIMLCEAGARIENATLAPRRSFLAATHAAAAVVAEVAVAGADGDGAAVVAGRGVGLEVGELLAAGGVGALVFEHDAGAGQQCGADIAVCAVPTGRAGTIRVAVGVTVCVAVFVRGRRLGTGG